MPEDQQVREGPGRTGLQNLAICGSHLGFQRGRDRLTGGQLGMPEPSAGAAETGAGGSCLRGQRRPAGEGAGPWTSPGTLKFASPSGASRGQTVCLGSLEDDCLGGGQRGLKISLGRTHPSHSPWDLSKNNQASPVPYRARHGKQGSASTHKGRVQDPLWGPVALITNTTCLTLYPPVPSSYSYCEPATCPQLGLGNEKNYRLALSTGIRQST